MGGYWHHIDSSFIDGVAYDRALKTLSVKIKGNNIYTFKDVPKDIYKLFLSSMSKGKFFNSELKDNYIWVKDS